MEVDALLKNMFFPLLILKGIYHYWKYVIFFQGAISPSVHFAKGC